MTTIVIAFLIAVAAAQADGGYRSWPMPKNWRAWHYPVWQRQAICIHRHEAIRWDTNTGNGYYGGMQFLLSTWQRAGGTGYPHQWPAREQLYRAWVIVQSHGGSWVEWGTRGMCGL